MPPQSVQESPSWKSSPVPAHAGHLVGTDVPLIRDPRDPDDPVDGFVPLGKFREVVSTHHQYITRSNLPQEGVRGHGDRRLLRGDYGGGGGFVPGLQEGTAGVFRLFSLAQVVDTSLQGEEELRDKWHQLHGMS